MSGTVGPLDILQRMENAVEHVRRRLLLATRALTAHGVPHAVVGGNAVAAWVATIDEAAVRNTRDVDILIRRTDFAAAKAALEAAGLIHRKVAGIDLFTESADPRARSAVHIVYAGEIVRPGEPAANPDVSESTDLGQFRAINLEALVRIKLTAWRDKDRTHLRDLIELGLVDDAWVARFPGVLSERLQSLLDTPGG
jgi:hypothetical protein